MKLKLRKEFNFETMIKNRIKTQAKVSQMKYLIFDKCGTAEH